MRPCHFLFHLRYLQGKLQEATAKHEAAAEKLAQQHAEEKGLRVKLGDELAQLRKDKEAREAQLLAEVPRSARCLFLQFLFVICL